ncbi:hypothetical protein A3K01_00660 [candidate division WWE3 bacterium RIFOXYD1_FULL_43_17]|uniref:Uncharacterized protein n=3 Tax=Katanobacteria TaxID=422282 RepID=A0A1F4XEQ3_UNCKA|nr:MAG: hypothetical protein UU59_C0021G0008 [candidate division WWE3 bacterium GW2011_GWE1_41_27]KKS59816.1 MAG: hypothetical protein UV26_C0014G0009 [candidate division WWE3 bacterium GW2011_GWF2_42_42]OGC80126.1 MAG: hypothetical protein A3K01_00660 [candidate division WWE3 bacterium RIFOXYD1_FULL_43_17]
MNRQSVPDEISSTYDEILNWGAKPRDTASLTELEYGFTSERNPSRLLNKLKGQGVVLEWKFLSKNKSTNSKGPIKSLVNKAKTFEELKKRFGTSLGGKP